MTTFSQLIDEVYVELVRPDMKGMLPAYLNQTIRELHQNSLTNPSMPVFYDDNRMEAEVVVTGADVNQGIFLWSIPVTSQFQAMEAVWYAGANVYAKERNPSTARLRTMSSVDDKYYFYRTGPQYAFSCTGGDGQKIQLSWFEYPRTLKYYPNDATRPMSYDVETQTYTRNPNYTPVQSDAQAQLLTVNWLLDRHEDTLKEGLRAKAYKRMGEEFRASRCYSQFENMRSGVQAAESLDLSASYGR